MGKWTSTTAAAIVLAAAVIATVSVVAAAQEPTPQEIARAQRNIFASMGSEEKVMLIRCQLCHDVLDAIKGYVAGNEVAVRGERGATIAAKACEIVSAALAEGGVIFQQRGPQYAAAAMDLVRETCGLLMDDIAPQYAVYVDALIDGKAADQDAPLLPCDAICPGAADKMRQQQRMHDALKNIRASDERRQEAASEYERRKASTETSWFADALLVGGLGVVAWLSVKAYRLTAASNPTQRGKKALRKK